jgi:hypothetical protein
MCSNFYYIFFGQVELGNAGTHNLDPCRSSKFIIKERFQCPSEKVAYNRRFDYILSLNIFLREATNEGDNMYYHNSFFYISHKLVKTKFKNFIWTYLQNNYKLS